MPPLHKMERQQQTGTVSEPSLLRGLVLWLDVEVSVSEKDKLGGEAAEERL